MYSGYWASTWLGFLASVKSALFPRFGTVVIMVVIGQVARLHMIYACHKNMKDTDTFQVCNVFTSKEESSKYQQW